MTNNIIIMNNDNIWSHTSIKVYILAFIKRGLNVIYTDVDTIWLKDPRSFLNDHYDMWDLRMDLCIIVQDLWRLNRHSGEDTCVWLLIS
jgi:hypothetical protein